jgi:hypothetical protein
LPSRWPWWYVVLMVFAALRFAVAGTWARAALTGRTGHISPRHAGGPCVEPRRTAGTDCGCGPPSHSWLHAWAHHTCGNGGTTTESGTTGCPLAGRCSYGLASGFAEWFSATSMARCRSRSRKTLVAAVILALVAIFVGVGYTPAVRYFVVYGLVILFGILRIAIVVYIVRLLGKAYQIQSLQASSVLGGTTVDDSHYSGSPAYLERSNFSPCFYSAPHSSLGWI